MGDRRVKWSQFTDEKLFFFCANHFSRRNSIVRKEECLKSNLVCFGGKLSISLGGIYQLV